MTTNITPNNSILKNLQNRIIEIFQVFIQNFNNFSYQYPNSVQIIQLSFIYYFALVDLIFGILTNVFGLGYFPELLKPVFPIINGILSNPIFKMCNSPEKIFFLSYLVIEVMITRSLLKFSKLVKYNVLLIFALLMIQGLVISYWDLLFHREVANGIQKWLFDETGLIYNDKLLSVLVFFITFLVFFGLYAYLYLRSIKGKFATFPGLTWLTDSVAFWLKIKTPTMRFGLRKKRRDKKK